MQYHESHVNICQKTSDSTMIFGYIFINRIQPFEAANTLKAFLCRPNIQHYSRHEFLNKFQDDILCALAIYLYM